MIVLFDERNPVADQFYEAGCFVRDWFLSRTLLVMPAGDPVAAVEVGAGSPRTGAGRAAAARGGPAAWPSDPWVAGAAANRAAARRGPGLWRAGAGCRDGPGWARPSTRLRPVCREAVETLRLGYRLGTESGRERVVYGDLPFSPLLRESPEFFSTILATTSARRRSRRRKKPKQLVLPRGTASGGRARSTPSRLSTPARSIRRRGCTTWRPRPPKRPPTWPTGSCAGSRPAHGASRGQVRVPMFYGSPAHTRVRAVGLSTRPARELECGASAVVGYVVGFNMLEPSVPPRVPACALTVAPEGFSEDQLGAVVDMVGGAALDLTTAPGKPDAPGRFFLNFAAPYGTGPPRRGPGAAAAAIATGITRRRTMRVPGMVHGGS